MKMEKDEELKLLKEAFEKFVKASDELQTSYNQLKERAKNLELELKVVNKKLKKSLREKEKLSSYLSNIIEGISVGILILDNSGKITLYNKNMKKKLPFLEKGIKLSEIKKVGITEEFLSALERGEEFEKEIKDNNFIYLLSFGKLKGKRKKIGYYFILKDISDIKKLEREVARTNRLRAMGEMAAELAHEIRNPLGSIELYASMLEEDLKTAKLNSDFIKFIREEIKKLNSLVTNILLFTRDITVSPKKIKVKNYLKNILNLITPLANSENINIVLNIKEDYVVFDPELFERVFYNLILNSIHALKGKKKGKIEIGLRKEKSTQIITVKDNGEGIDREILDKIFNPFFTTKAKGSGLGLSVVYRIVKAHNGKIFINSEKGKGTEIIIEIEEGKGD